MSEKRCEKCNSVIFEVEPFKTTQQAIIEFAQRSSLPEYEKKSIIQSKWMHPGYYCPNGCSTTLVDGPLPLPSMTPNESISIATEYARKYLEQFLQTHGTNSRIVACVFCKNFHGAVLEGESSTSVYHQPKHKPLCNKKAVFVNCSDLRIQELKNQFWYTTGKTRAECAYFKYDESFKWVYKDVTGWSEYPDS